MKDNAQSKVPNCNSMEKNASGQHAGAPAGPFAGGCFTHWRQPSMMLGSLLAGTVAAISHHVFYNSLDGQVVGDESSQQWNFRIGTGFAFLVRVFLSLSMGTAIVQCFWHSLQTNKRPVTLENLDHLFTISTSLPGLFQPGVWAFNPLMVLLAVVSWCLPLAVIVAPTTLSIGPTVMLPQPGLLYRVPRIRYASLARTSSLPNDDKVFFNSANEKLSALAGIVTYSGAIYPATAPSPNCSYTLTFFAPTLHCHPFRVPYVGLADPDDPESPREYIYVSAPINSSTTIVEQLQMHNTSLSLDSSTSYSPLDTTRNAGGMKLYIVRNGTFLGEIRDGFLSLEQSKQLWEDGAAVTECHVSNSSLTVEFSYTNGVQELNVVHEKIIHEVAAVDHLAHDSDPIAFEVMGYMAITESVGNLIGGWLVWEPKFEVRGTSKVTGTALVNAEEFDGYRRFYEMTLRRSFGFGRSGNRSLAFGVESLFRNVTLSLFSIQDTTYVLDSSAALHALPFSSREKNEDGKFETL